MSFDRIRRLLLNAATIVFIALTAGHAIVAQETGTSVDSVDIPINVARVDSRPQNPTMAQIYDSVGDPFRDGFQWPEVTAADWEAEWSDTGYFDAGGFILESHKRFIETPHVYEAFIEEFNRIRVTSETGKSHREFEITLVALEQDPDPEFRARVIFPDGKIIEMNPNSVKRQLMDEKPIGRLITYSYSVPEVTENCIVDHYLKYRESFAPERHWCFQSTSPTKSAHCYWYPAHEIVPLDAQESLQAFEYLNRKFRGNYRLDIDTLHVPDDRNISYIWKGAHGRGKTNFVPIPKPVVVHFSVENVPGFQSEPQSIPEQYQVSHLNFFRSAVSNDSSFWETTTAELSKTYSEFCKRDDRAHRIARQIMKDVDPVNWIDSALARIRRELLNKECQKWHIERERIDNLFKWRGETRVEFKENDNVDDALKHGYADVVEFALVFQRIMLAMEFDAEVAFVCDREITEFDKDLPEWQFDYATVRVRNDSIDVWCDPAAPFMPAGDLRWVHQGITALLLSEDSAYFGETPILQETRNEELRSIIVDSFDEQGWSGAETITCWGTLAHDLRSFLWPINPAGHATRVLEFFDDIRVAPDSIVISGVYDIHAPITLEFKRSVMSSGFTTGSRLLVPLEDFIGKYDTPFDANERTQPIRLLCQYAVNREIRIKLPENWSASQAGDWEELEASFGSGQVQFTQVGEDLLVTTHFNITTPFLEKESYLEVKRLYEWRQALGQLTIAFQPDSQ